MTMAISKAVERGAKVVDLRVHRQHVGVGGGVRGAGRTACGGA